MPKLKDGVGTDIRVQGNEIYIDADSSEVASQLLATLLTVDGAGSGLDADTLDGLEGSGYVTQAEVAVADGVASLDSNGKVPTTQMPALSLSEIFVVADNTARDALTVQEGDVAKVTGDGLTYIYDGTQWIEIVAAYAVDSVNGKTGVVVLAAVDINYDNTASGLLASNLQAAIDELQAEKASVSLLSSNIILYPTSAASAVGGFNKLVTSIDDPDYDSTAVDFSTGAITGDDQVVGALISEPGIIDGNPGVINISTVGNIRRVSGNKTASFYFKVFKRDSGGVEELLAESDPTPEITSATYRQFGEAALLNNGVFVSTDRIVVRFYASPSGSGNDPVYEFQFGGTDPVRTLLPVPVEVVPSDDAVDIGVDTAAFGGVLSGSDSTVQAALDTLDDHTHEVNTLGSSGVTNGFLPVADGSGGVVWESAGTAAAGDYVEYVDQFGEGVITKVVRLTQAQYDSIGTKDAETLYVII